MEKKLIREVELENGEIISDPVQVNNVTGDFTDQNRYTSENQHLKLLISYMNTIKGLTALLRVFNVHNKMWRNRNPKDLTLEGLKDALASFEDKTKSRGKVGLTK